MKIQTKYVVIGVFALLLAVFLCGWYIGIKKERYSSTSDRNTYVNRIDSLILVLNGKTTYIYKIEQEISTQKQLIRDGEIEKKTLKALNLKQANEITKLSFRVDTLLDNVGHTGQIVVVHDTITQLPINALLLPFDFEKEDEWLTLKGNFDSFGKPTIMLGLNFNAELLIGLNKKTKKNTAILYTECPYVKTVSFTSVKLDTPRIKRYGIGIQFGYGMSKNATLTPYVGLGVSYNLIRF